MNTNDVEQRQSTHAGDDGERQLLGRLDDAGDVEEQGDDEHAHRREDRGADDAVGLGVEHRRDRAEAEPLAHGVENAEQRRPPRLDGDEDAEEEGAEAGQPEARQGCVTVVLA